MTQSIELHHPGDGHRSYRRRSPAEWARIADLYRQGIPARALSRRFGGSERAIFNHLRDIGALRRDNPIEDRPSPEQQHQAMDAAPPPDDPETLCDAMPADASLETAGQTAARAAILALKKADLSNAAAYARIADMLQRLDHAERARNAAPAAGEVLRLEAVAYLHRAQADGEARLLASPDDDPHGGEDARI